MNGQQMDLYIWIYVGPHLSFSMTRARHMIVLECYRNGQGVKLEAEGTRHTSNKLVAWHGMAWSCCASRR